MDIFKAFKTFKLGHYRSLRHNDFFSDRIFHQMTTRIIIVFLVILTVKRFFSNPIHCWVPAELKRYERYMNSYCWLRGTYYIEQFYDVYKTFSIEQREESTLRYYQWIQIFLSVQAFLFYFPRIIWTFVTQKMLSYDLFNMVFINLI
jgi:innexin